MPGLRVGIAVRWTEVERLIQAMLETLGHRWVAPAAGDSPPPDVVVRDPECEGPAGWAGRPTVLLSGAASGVVLAECGRLYLGKPFTTDQLAAAIRRAVEEAG